MSEQDIEKRISESLRSHFEGYQARLVEEVKKEVEESNKIDPEKLAKMIASSLDLEKLSQHYGNDEVHQLQHEWIKQQIQKEKRINDMIWNTKGAIVVFALMSFIGGIGWAFIHFIKDIVGQ